MRKLLGGIFFLGLLGIMLDRWNDHNVPESSTIASTETRDSKGATIPRWPAQRGTELSYQLRYEGIWQDSARFAVAGQIRLAVLSADDTPPYIGLLRIDLDPDSQELKTIPEDWRRQLMNFANVGVGVTFENRGWALQLDRPDALSAQARDFWQQLLERTQVRLPETWSKEGFTAQEPYGKQMIDVRYRSENDDASGFPLSLSKSWNAQLSVAQHSKGSLTYTRKSELSLPERISSQSHETWSSSQVGFDAKTVIDMQWLNQRSLSEGELARLDQALASTRSGPALLASTHEQEIQKQALQGQSLADLWKQLKQKGQGSQGVSQELYLQLKAWITLHPEQGSELLDLLLARSPDDPVLRSAIKALTAVGHPSAQQTLRTLLDHAKDQPSDLAQRLVTSLGFVTHPVPESQQALLDLMRSTQDPKLAQSASLALGIMGRHLVQEAQVSSRERAAEIERVAWQQLIEAKDLQQQRRALGMLGNLGPSQWKQLEPYFADSNPDLRASAYMALRFAEDSQVSQVLGRAYGNEKAPGVQHDILESLALRTPDPLWFQTLTHLVEDGQLSASDQLFLGRAASRHGQKYPDEVRKFLQLSISKTKEVQAKASLESLMQFASGRQSVL